MVGSLRFRLKKKKSSPTRVDLDFGVHSQIDSDFFFFVSQIFLSFVLQCLKRIIGVETTEDEV